MSGMQTINYSKCHIRISSSRTLHLRLVTLDVNQYSTASGKPTTSAYIRADSDRWEVFNHVFEISIINYLTYEYNVF